MSRRLIIAILVFLIFAIIAGMAYMLYLYLQEDEVAPPPDTEAPATPIDPADPTDPPLIDPETGLPVEDPSAPIDTDPAEDLPPAEDIDDLFSDDVDLEPTVNLTEAYFDQYPREERNNMTIVQFVRSQPITTRLPTVREDALTVSPDASPQALALYVNQAEDLNALANISMVSRGLNELIRNRNTSSIGAARDRVIGYQNTLRLIDPPPQAVETHRILLGYTELLISTYGQLMGWNDDPIRAFVAIRQLEEIDRIYYPLIVRHLSELYPSS